MNIEDAWISLMEHEPEVCVRMLTVRYIMEQRGYTHLDIAKVSKTTRQRSAMYVNPRFVWHAGNDPGPGLRVTVTTTHANLDKVEHAITLLSRRDKWSPPENAKELWDEEIMTRREEKFYAANE